MSEQRADYDAGRLADIERSLSVFSSRHPSDDDITYLLAKVRRYEAALREVVEIVESVDVDDGGWLAAETAREALEDDAQEEA